MSEPNDTQKQQRARSSRRDRRKLCLLAPVMPVRLTRKFAEEIDGIDLSKRAVGERLPLSESEARLLIREGWAEPVAANDRRRSPARRVPRKRPARDV